MSGKLDYINMIKKVSPYNLKKGILYLRHYGPKGFWIKLTERFQKSDIDYKEWYEKHLGTGIQYTGGVFKADDPVSEKADLYELGIVYCQC